MAQHLLECAPCRAEAEGLAEVDRRLHRLGVYRGLSVAELMLRLDEQLGQAPKAEQRGLRPATLLIAVTISLALLVGAALLLLLLSTR